MPTPSPSSRLVLAAIAAAVVGLAVAGALRPQTTGPTGTATPGGVAAASSSDSTASGFVEIPTDLAASPTPHGTVPSTASTSITATLSPTPQATTSLATCKPTDQDQYVYNPARLAVQAACIHVTGTVQAVRREADGDLHILLALDPAFAHLLTPANQGVELGDLVVEPVCVKSVTQTDAIAICASDLDPLAGPFPAVGDRIWMEGRYVFDLQHGGWAELHPLYRWNYT